MELVVGASTATMDSLLGKLGNILAQEYDLIRGVRGDIQYISDELASMKAFLLDLAREDPDNRKKHWMKQIRDMAYDCEDCIDDFAHRLPNDANFDPKCCPWIVTLVYDLWTFWPRREIASSIAELKVRAQLIADRRIRYGVENPDTQNGKGPPDALSYDIAQDQLASHVLRGMEEPVGMEKDMKKLEQWVHSAVEKPAVVSIVGFGGVGKTTIAMALYKKVMYHFECRAWVTVSQNYDRDALLNDILKQIDPDHNMPRSKTWGTSENKKRPQRIVSKLKRDVQRTASLRRGRSVEEVSNLQHNGNSGNTLESQIKKHLKKKRYIILVDDIWSAKTWTEISAYLLLDDNELRSRVIVTSRFQAVGSTCYRQDRGDLLHTISFLSPGDSKELFSRSVSESTSTDVRHKVQNSVPDYLWKRCGGQPLAIVVMAGLVACNQDQPKIWDRLQKLLPEEVSITAGAQEQNTSLNMDGVTRILDCCYNNMPGYLRTCLLYMAIFPKGWKISRKCLSRRWIAEGFVNQRQGLTAEEVAESYFNHILRRKLIRPVEHSSNGKLKTFQVHDMVLDYIVTKAREENFITVVGGHLMMTAPSNNKVRRLSMQSSSSKHGDSTKGMNLSQVRSLTVFGGLTQVPFHAFNDRIIQVLDFQGLKGFQDRHMKHICKMFVLKYLSLRGTDITKVPSTIVKLKCLETLDIRETGVTELPNEVQQLKLISKILGGSKNKNRREGLRLSQEKSKKQQNKSVLLAHDKEKEGMKALRILSGIKVDKTTPVASLHQLTGLKKLTIYNLQLNPDPEEPDTSKILTELRSSIEYLCSCGLQTLAINEEGQSNFINSLGEMSAPPRYLVALELSGMLENPPGWIETLRTLSKLTLSVTVLRTETLKLLRALPLFSLTFSFSFGDMNHRLAEIIENNKSQSDGEVFVPDGGFKSLKLLRLFAPLVPKLGFCHNATPELELIEMQFQVFEGLFGIDTLENLKGVRLSEMKHSEQDERTIINQLLVRELKDSTEGLKKVIIDHTFTS